MMVSRCSGGIEGPPPSSKPQSAPAKARLARLGSSPSKRDDRPKDERVAKTTAKDVAELKDYVWL
ncbi:hypothetical protein BDV36DRAFT_267027 [Aspergillus pseudocaelatus]|uniref:Uncharacterized protein n=1 Tax=Aspergillus pseudocaelatus TaxID=1825620 RepID=A0ABQ6W9V3_9EURO|nr:hypothetical protein BDV36DRAFT_267027 [Aspergillus pseudocaelatus]